MSSFYFFPTGVDKIGCILTCNVNVIKGFLFTDVLLLFSKNFLLILKFTPLFGANTFIYMLRSLTNITIDPALLLSTATCMQQLF